MYSTYVRQLSFAVEEMAESITEEESEYLKKKYEGMTLQALLFESSADEVLDYISHTKKQRETLKKYGPDTKRAELKYLACLHLEASLNMFQALSAYDTSIASGKTMVEKAVRIHNETIHSKLSSPLNYLTRKFAEISDFLEKIDADFSFIPPKE